MKYKIWFLLALFPYCLWGQSLFEDNTEKKGSIDYYLYHGLNFDINILFNKHQGLFPMDVVSVQEMKENYAVRNKKNWSGNVYEGKDSVADIDTGLMAQSVMKTCPIKGAQDLRAIWEEQPLRLKAILNADGTENLVVYKNVQKVSSSERPLPYWYDGVLTYLKKPARYWNFVVSSDASFYRWFAGNFCHYSYNSQFYPDYFSYVGGNVFNGNWYEPIPGGMRRLAAEVNATSLGTKFIKRDLNLEFVFLLVFDIQQRCHIELLDPQKLDADGQEYFDLLNHFFKQLRPGIFQNLYTSDGRIFPARYIRARLDSRGWQFKDLLQTE